jgi:hypothetical protein
MTPADAATLGDGDVVVSWRTTPPLKPLTVDRVWVNAAGTVARVLVRGEPALRHQWLPADGLYRPPPGYLWAPRRASWVRPIDGSHHVWSGPDPAAPTL